MTSVACFVVEFAAMLQHNPSLQDKAAELQVRKEKSMYEELFGKPFTENRTFARSCQSHYKLTTAIVNCTLYMYVCA